MSVNFLEKPDLVIDFLPINQKYFAVIKPHDNTAYRFSSGGMYKLQKGIFRFDALCLESRVTEFSMLSNTELELANNPSFHYSTKVSFISFKNPDTLALLTQQ